MNKSPKPKSSIYTYGQINKWYSHDERQIPGDFAFSSKVRIDAAFTVEQFANAAILKIAISSCSNIGRSRVPPSHTCSVQRDLTASRKEPRSVSSMRDMRYNYCYYGAQRGTKSECLNVRPANLRGISKYNIHVRSSERRGCNGSEQTFIGAFTTEGNLAYLACLRFSDAKTQVLFFLPAVAFMRVWCVRILIRLSRRRVVLR